MKSISPENRERIRRLSSGSLWSRLIAGSAEQIGLLQAIGFSNETAAIPEISHFLVSTHGRVWRAAAEAVHRLLDMINPMELTSLEQGIRTNGSYDWEVDPRWHRLEPSHVSRFAETEFGSSLCGLSSFHGNGYVRKIAVDELCKIKDGSELPFLLLRINDWVPIIRTSAAAGVRKRLVPEYAPHFVKNLLLVLHLENRGRADKGMVEEIRFLLRRPECREALQKVFFFKDCKLRRVGFQLAAEIDEPGRILIIRAAIADPDPVTRAWAAKRFLPLVADGDLPQTVRDLLNDRFMPVRQAALWALASRRSDSAAEHLRSALLDSSASMRETARHFLAQSSFEFGPYYLAAIQDANLQTLPTAIRGLGETGEKEDALRILPFLSAKEPTLRKAAIYALGKLNAEDFLPAFLTGLMDIHSGVSRESVRASINHARLFNLEDLWELFQNDHRPFVRKHVLMLLLKRGKWERLAPLLRACRDVHPSIANMAKVAITKWIWNYNSSFAEPSIRQIREIRKALEDCSDSLDAKIIKEISACIITFEK